MSLPLRLTLAAAVLLAAPAAAHAGDPLFPEDTIDIEIRLPHDDNVDESEPAPAGQEGYPLEKRFGLARCLCSQLQPDDPRFRFTAKFTLDPRPEGVTAVEDMQIWMGPSCNSDLQTRTNSCGGPVDTSVTDIISELPYTQDYAVTDLLDPTGEKGCPTNNGKTYVWAFTDIEPDDDFEDEGSWPLDYDGDPPPVPTRFTVATGGENAITLNWELPESNSEDIAFWQVLCAKSDGTAALDAPSDRAEYETSHTLCGDSNLPGITTIPVKGDANQSPSPVDLPTGLDDLDESFICATGRKTDTSIRVENLDNGQPYYVVLVAVDKAGNARGVTPPRTLIPTLASDFWEELNPDGEDVEGGYCLIAETYGEGGGLTGALRAFRDQTLAASAPGRALVGIYYKVGAPVAALAHQSLIARVVLGVLLLPLVAIALLWHVLTLPGLIALGVALVWLRRARKLRRAVPALAALSVLLLASTASAQQSWSPYWDDDTQLDESGPEDIKWHVGIKLGPYVPEIDEMFDGRTPFADTFPDKFAPMPVLEIDRFFLYPGGQLGVGGSIGYFGRKASAFLETDPTPGDGVRDRSPGDKTTFRMLPLALNVVYRWTAGDDEWGVPVVPYVRGGLAYYLWRITAPSGNTASVPLDPMCDTSGDVKCERNRARGGSLGVQGSIGLAIRAERIDESAAASMRDSGLYHAGFYVEYQLAWVNDFGKGNKLSVGDDTWYAGIDFEF